MLVGVYLSLDIAIATVIVISVSIAFAIAVDIVVAVIVAIAVFVTFTLVVSVAVAITTALAVVNKLLYDLFVILIYNYFSPCVCSGRLPDFLSLLMLNIYLIIKTEDISPY